MNLRYSFIISLLLTSCFTLISIPAVTAGGAGAGFGDYGDFGISEGARMAADPYYPGLIAGNISATSSTPRVLTPLPTATPVQAVTNQTRNNTENRNSTHATPAVASNVSNGGNISERSKNLTSNSSIGDLIRAGDWDALNAYQAQKRADNAAFTSTNEKNSSDRERAAEAENEDDSVVTVVYPCS